MAPPVPMRCRHGPPAIAWHADILRAAKRANKDYSASKASLRQPWRGTPIRQPRCALQQAHILWMLQPHSFIGLVRLLKRQPGRQHRLSSSSPLTPKPCSGYRAPHCATSHLSKKFMFLTIALALQSGKGHHIVQKRPRRLGPLLGSRGVVAAWPRAASLRHLQQHARHYLPGDTLVVRSAAWTHLTGVVLR